MAFVLSEEEEMSETHLEIITRQLAEARGEADYWRNRAAKFFARNAKLEAEIAQYKVELKETVLTALRFNSKLKADALKRIQGTKRTGKGVKS